jgi:hypothetical protein
MKISFKSFQIILVLLFVVLMQPAAGRPQSKPIPTDCIPLLSKANIAYEHLQYSIAAPLFESFLKNARSSDGETLFKLWDCYWQMHAYNQCNLVIKRVDRMYFTHLTSLQKIHLSNLAARMENYTQAANWLKGMKGYESRVAGYMNPAALETLKKDSADWHISNLDINAGFNDFSPYLTDSLLIFCSNSPSAKSERAFSWDGKSYVRLWYVPLYKIGFSALTSKPVNSPVNTNVISTTKFLTPVYEGSDTKPIDRNGVLTEGVNFLALKNQGKISLLGGLTNFKYNVGPASIDMNNTIYFSVNQSKAGKDAKDRISIMQGKLTENKVVHLKPLPFGDKNQYSVMHPAIDPSGKLLIFSSDKPDGQGGYDLYYSRRSDTKSAWDTPKPFSLNINTVGNEVFPYCSPDSALYFSSDGRAGFGGLDIYRISIKNALNGTGEPELMSYPINSQGDDFGWVEDRSLKSGYFTSDRKDGNDNIYHFSSNKTLSITSIPKVENHSK